MATTMITDRGNVLITSGVGGVPALVERSLSVAVAVLVLFAEARSAKSISNTWDIDCIELSVHTTSDKRIIHA